MAIDTLVINREIGADTSPIRLFDITLTGDDAYPTGGTADIESVLRGLLEDARTRFGSLSNLRLLSVDNTHAAATYALYFDRVNNKLLVRALADNAEVANATDLSASTFRLLTTWG